MLIWSRFHRGSALSRRLRSKKWQVSIAQVVESRTLDDETRLRRCSNTGLSRRHLLHHSSVLVLLVRSSITGSSSPGRFCERLEPRCGESRTSGSEGAGARQRAPATRLLDKLHRLGYNHTHSSHKTYYPRRNDLSRA